MPTAEAGTVPVTAPVVAEVVSHAGGAAGVRPLAGAKVVTHVRSRGPSSGSVPVGWTRTAVPASATTSARAAMEGARLARTRIVNFSRSFARPSVTVSSNR